MNRRNFLAASGAVGTGALAGCAGVLGSGGGTDGSGVTTTPGPRQGDPLPTDESPGDGYAPSYDEFPPEQDISSENFGSNTVPGGDIYNGDSDVTVTLASIETTYYWYARGEARFVDSRSGVAYDNAHVHGAVLSSANYAIEQTPVAEWDTEDRVVCYCRCPHHLSSIRAAELMNYGFEEVYVIDEGFGEWLKDYEFPVAGTGVNANLDPWTIVGQTDAGDAGQTAYTRHPESGQREATPIASDGSYSMGLYFYGVTPDTEITVETPSYTVTDDLSSLSSGTVTADD